ncbi:hypothetical protein [Streptomyces clavuligerus]|uniref:Uncharacterized protein n=1 Tax=Streptomyces clavuligerus TaxID=1901 RepID=B5GM50_STRCL|nr:hypothetical protein [Streptomyces clavuligerus]EDY47396.1 hypothetical protein SSCG_00424 [Streptomyces clavuligerus]EFG05053.1 Hypothetical protein SCLAV_p1572 [Streptomyces clavuligerus]MBY6306540.1 hypothetical protein [Streptomyces clavuligerus]QCS10850.1 hypothetical protein CRV15_35695 [Streptomyces clavuligerus]QPJ97109.1 hypothetical protein GE265_28760 [Streptomyces clavuligerus]
MSRLRLFARKDFHVSSWFGIPVEAGVKTVPITGMRELVAAANRRGYSRKGTGLDLEGSQRFALIPYLPENSPEASWMCLVAAFPHSFTLAVAERPRCTFGRIDVSTVDFESLPSADSATRDQLLHWMMWEAYRAHQ